MTLKEALNQASTILFDIEYTVDYNAYIDRCNPTSCTYYESTFWRRIVHALALTMALFGPIVKSLRPLFRMAVDTKCCCSK